MSRPEAPIADSATTADALEPGATETLGAVRDGMAATAMTGMTDGDLARLAAKGSQQAASILILRYERLVRSFLRKITGKPDTADDLAQETFVRLLKHAGSYDEQYPMRTWLLTIARRLSINHSRRADQQVGRTEYEGHRSTFDGPFERVEADDMQRTNRKMINEALAQLSTSQRQVIVLFHEQELSIEQVAQVMEMPLGTIKSHLHRARAAMRKILEPKRAEGFGPGA